MHNEQFGIIFFESKMETKIIQNRNRNMLLNEEHFLDNHHAQVSKKVDTTLLKLWWT